MLSKVAKEKCIKEVVKEESMTRRDDDDDDDDENKKDEKSDESTLPSSPSFPCFPSHRPHTKFGRNDDVCNRTFWHRFISKDS